MHGSKISVENSGGVSEEVQQGEFHCSCFVFLKSADIVD